MKPLRVLGWGLALATAAGALAWACRQQAPAPSVPASDWFVDITDECGLDFVHDGGRTDSFFMPQALGSGAALLDFNNDGRLDIYLLQNGGPQGATNCLYQQGPDGRFRNVSAGSGLDIAGYNMGVAVGDVNNDGYPDVLVTQYGGIKLFLNNRNGTFRDVTREAGLDNPAWGVSAAFLDYDGDGWLDLVVVNYVDYDPTWPCTTVSGQPDYCPPKTFPGRVTRLFHNLGAAAGNRQVVRFQDVTVASGLGSLAGPGLGVLCADFDGDGWPDIFVANDGRPNRLWINRHDGTFTEEAVSRGVAYNALGQAEAGMGVALGDVDGDGLADLFVTHLTEETNTLWRQGPRGLFRDRTAAFGLTGVRWRGTGFGTILADFDHNGTLDLAVVNGRVSRGADANPALGRHWSRYAERNQLFANDGGHFRDVSPDQPAFCATPNVARGLACGDVDGDGALDLLVTTAAGRARLYRNVAATLPVPGGHWLLVRATDPDLGGRDALGAEVRVRAAGSRSWTRLINSGTSYLCSSDPRAHFGLGPVERVEEITVLWPNGTVETFDGCSVDQRLELRRGTGRRREPRRRQGP